MCKGSCALRAKLASFAVFSSALRAAHSGYRPFSHGGLSRLDPLALIAKAEISLPPPAVFGACYQIRQMGKKARGWRKALPTRPTGSGIHLKIPPVDLWTTHLFYFFQNPPTERLACSERYRAKAIVTDVSKVNRALRSPAPLISRAHDSSRSHRPRPGSLVPRRSCAGSANGSGKGFPVTDRRRLAHLRIERAMRARPGLLASRPNYRPANEISGVCPLDAKRAEQVRVRSRLVALTFRVVTYGRSRNAASLKLSRLNASPPAQPALL